MISRATIAPVYPIQLFTDADWQEGVGVEGDMVAQSSLGTVYEPCARFWLNQELILDRARVCYLTARSEHEQSKDRYESHPAVSLFYLVLMHVGSPLRT